MSQVQSQTWRRLSQPEGGQEMEKPLPSPLLLRQGASFCLWETILWYEKVEDRNEEEDFLRGELRLTSSEGCTPHPSPPTPCSSHGSSWNRVLCCPLLTALHIATPLLQPGAPVTACLLGSAVSHSPTGRAARTSRDLSRDLNLQGNMNWSCVRTSARPRPPMPPRPA